MQDFISSGLSPDDHQAVRELPGGLDFFAYLSGIPKPLRVADFSAHTSSLGLPPIAPPLGPVGSFLGAPIRHRGRQAGNLYLWDREGGAEFSDEDAETLVSTSPVGVVLFDARSGELVSYNREARRIVEGLRDLEQPPEELLHELIFRRGDGREVSLAESPLAETVRGEEVVMTVPDGRSVTTLVNATLIRSEQGEGESMVPRACPCVRAFAVPGQGTAVRRGPAPPLPSMCAGSLRCRRSCGAPGQPLPYWSYSSRCQPEPKTYPS